MEPVRSVLYLDFDNVFGGLLKLDPRLAVRFAEQPQLWLTGLASHSQEDVARRWLLLRCYMNPAGWVPHPDNDGARLYFSKFRPYFTDAGFEVVDCPRLSHTKNGADIRLVIDAVEALRADVRYEEFVIASGDSDMTPLIVRLRSSDRRTTLLSPSDSAVVLGAVADRLIGGEELLELLGMPTADLEEPLEEQLVQAVDSRVDPRPQEQALSVEEATAKFRELVTERYDEATEPIHLGKLSNDVRRALGSVAISSRWFGYDGFTQALQALDLPKVRIWQQSMWDTTRHTPPTSGDVGVVGSQGEDAVARITRLLKLPQLPTESWRSIFDSLAAFVAAYEFNLTEATRWSRDRIAESGIPVNRQAVGIVARGASFGGCPLYRQPPPEADEIAAAFSANVLARAAAADIDLSADEVHQVRSWLGTS